MHFKQILVLLLCCLQPRLVSCEIVTRCDEEFGSNCIKCSDQCLECRTGYYGSRCEEECIGNCQFDCDIKTGLCRTCQDGFHAENCSLPCSMTCLGPACERSNGACYGCTDGYCSASTGCDKTCCDNCPKHCDFETCKCLRSASPQTVSTAPCPPKQGKCPVKNSILTYSIGSIFHTVYLVIGFILYRYEQKLLTSLYCQWQKTPRREHGETVQREPLADECIETKFQEIPNDKADSDARHALANKDKNNHRYSYPYDDNRVRLDNNEYINATHVYGTTLGISRSYITTQQPMKNTKNSFWHMIWQNEVGTIVVLSSNPKNEIDRNLRGVNKCHDFGDIKVRTNGALISKPSCTVRKLKIQKENDNRPQMDVDIVLFSKWYRKGSLCDFLEELRGDATFTRNTSPVTIFSSEGEGPASIFISLDYLMESLNTGDNHNPPDMYECVNRLAEQRRSMFPDVTSLKRLRQCYRLLREKNPVSRSTRSNWVRCLAFLAIYVLLNIVGVKICMSI